MMYSSVWLTAAHLLTNGPPQRQRCWCRWCCCFWQCSRHRRIDDRRQSKFRPAHALAMCRRIPAVLMMLWPSWGPLCVSFYVARAPAVWLWTFPLHQLRMHKLLLLLLVLHLLLPLKLPCPVVVLKAAMRNWNGNEKLFQYLPSTIRTTMRTMLLVGLEKKSCYLYP